MQWKLDGCKTFEMGYTEHVSKRRKLPGTLANNPDFVGSAELSLMNAQAKDISKIMVKTPLPTLEKHLEDLDYQILPNGDIRADVEEEWVKYNEDRFNWVGVRIALRENLGLFRTEIDVEKPLKTLLMEWRRIRDEGKIKDDIKMESDE